MKRFIIKLLIFALPLCIFALAADFGFSYLLRQTNDYQGELEVWSDIYDSKASCDIAIYGSSRAWVNFNPLIIEDSLNKTVYNFGIDGHNFWLEYLRHLEFLKHNRKPELIIFSLDIFTFQKRPDLHIPNQFLPYMLWNRNIEKYTSSYIGYSTSDYYLPLVRYAGKKEAIKTSLDILFNGPPAKKYRTKGYLGMEKDWNSDFNNAKEKQGYFEIFFDPQTIALFETFIKECKQMGIELLLVYPPEHIDGQVFVKNRSDLFKIFIHFSTKHNLKFIDYSKIEICYDTMYFYNTGHLNKTGADIFSAILAGDIKKMQN